MHLHSPFVQNGKQGVSLIVIYFLLILAPMWALCFRLNRWMGSSMTPAIRPGKDHAHMAPRLLNHLKANNHENKVDHLGRRTATFYKNFTRQSMDIEMKPTIVKQLETHGFKF